MELKQNIKQYWQDKQPSLWYSKKSHGTKEYYDDVEQKRYNIFYPYIPKIAEFDKHKGEKVLEIGVGMGTDLKQYIRSGTICYGIDLTEGSIEETKKHLDVYGLNANLQVMDAKNLEFDGNTFDLVYSFGTLHHTPNTQKAIDEVHRVLKPDGKAIIMIYSKSWQHYLRRVLRIGIIGGELKRLGSMQELINVYSEAYGFSPLTKLYHKREIKEFFKNFKNVKIRHYHYKNNFFQTIYMQGNWIIKAIK